MRKDGYYVISYPGVLLGKQPAYFCNEKGWYVIGEDVPYSATESKDIIVHRELEIEQ